MLTLYDYLPSQNAYKVRLLLSHLKLQYRTINISIFEGEGQQPEYLSKNPTGAVPALELEDGTVIAESNAILFFLADDTQYLPADRYLRAKTVQWLSFEGDYIQSTIASLRHWTMTGKLARRPQALVDMKREGSLKTLSILDRELAKRPYLAGNSYTIADMSAFAYVHLSNEADLPLGDFPEVTAWIERVKSQPGFLEKVYPYSIDPHSGHELP